MGYKNNLFRTQPGKYPTFQLLCCTHFTVLSNITANNLGFYLYDCNTPNPSGAQPHNIKNSKIQEEHCNNSEINPVSACASDFHK